MTIRILPSEVASQIAAGEVVERPASVVKELLENAIDAGASYIAIEVEGAGKRRIQVSDDGQGIPPDELRLAVERHATSKLNDANDLFQIVTLGFRGEALASIASVSRMTITSRPPDEDLGARIRVDGGIAEAVEPSGVPEGTLVQVEDLFYNVPARMKFLKTDTTERRQIDALATRYALAYPHVRFHLYQDGKPALQTSGRGDRREVLGALYGPDIARQMLEVVSSSGDVRVQGFITPISVTRSNRREILFFVNGRPVQDTALTAAVLKGYHTLLMVGRYPLAVLFLELDPEKIDVNVHPTKAEVRFREQDTVFTAVQSAIRRALLAHTPVPELHRDQLRWSPPEQRETPAKSWELPPAEAPREESEENEAPAERLPTLGTPLLRLVGQIAASYLVAEGPDGLYLIDQHAAHERVLFERFLEQKGVGVPSQSLLQPATVELPVTQARMLEEQLPLLNSLGFQVEHFGRSTFLVRSVPTLLIRMEPADALRTLVEDFEEDETPLKSKTEERIIARVCKRAAVKAGKTLSTEEQQALLRDLEACRSPRTCPHGRPTMIHLSVDLLERQFGRRGAH